MSFFERYAFKYLSVELSLHVGVHSIILVKRDKVLLPRSNLKY